MERLVLQGRTRSPAAVTLACAVTAGSLGVAVATASSAAAPAVPPDCTTATAPGVTENADGTTTAVFVAQETDFVIPSGVQSVLLDVCGAAGSAAGGSGGGLGGRSSGSIGVDPDDVLRVVAGRSDGSLGSGGAGGAGNPSSGGAGGGYSAVFRDASSRGAAVLVAGGGGGAGGSTGGVGGAGGSGGGTQGQMGAFGSGAKNGAGGQPGTQDAVGAGGAGPYQGGSGASGAEMAGGAGQSTFTPAGGGGGGGGWYGGGGGGAADDSYTGDAGGAGGGGGGSGFVATAVIDGSMAAGQRSGHGVVVITYLADDEAPVASVSIDDDPISAANADSVVVTVAVTDARPATATVRLSDGSGGSTGEQEVVFAPGDGPRTLTFDTSGLADGTVTASGTATDGTNTSDPFTDTATKDTVAPTGSVTIEDDPVDRSNQAAVGVTVSAQDAATSTVTVRLSDESGGSTPEQQVVLAPGDGPAMLSFDATALADGVVTAHGTAADGANSSAPFSDTASKDTTVKTPSAPEDVEAVQTGPGRVTVSYAAPASDGGGAVTSYTVTLAQDGEVVRTATTEPDLLEVTFAGVEPGSYTTRVVASNAQGPGPAATAEVTVQPGPDAPVDVTAGESGPNQITVTFAPSTREGAPATAGFTVVLATEGGSVVERELPGAARQAVFDGVAVGSHTVSVVATNSHGSSAPVQRQVRVSPPFRPEPVAPLGSPSAAPSAAASATPASPATSPSASASAPASAGPSCTTVPTMTLDRSTIVATGSAGVTVTGTPGSTVELFAYSQPSRTYRAVRTATLPADGSAVRFAIVPPTNTRLYAQTVRCSTDHVLFSQVLNVRTQLSLDVVRNGTQDYTFSGRALPARPKGLVVSLYRVTDTGRQILTAQTRANAKPGQAGYDSTRPAGSYTINRVFTGTGRFGFVVRTGQDLQNAPGSSNIRSLLIF
jgi:hypothetical protein